jgi:hypothetical protein
MLWFPKLGALDIEIIDPRNEYIIPSPRGRQDRYLTHYSTMISAMVAKLSAKAYKITLTSEGCLWKLIEHKVGDCDCCEDFVERVTSSIRTEADIGISQT